MLNYQEKQQLRQEVDETWRIAKTPAAIQACFIEAAGNYITSNEFSDFSPIYKHGTEDMRGYYKAYNSVEDFLTIGGSGNQILNAVSLGAKRIDVFDKNALAKRGCALKVTAAKSLDKEKLLEYFKNHQKDTYEKIKHHLKEMDRAYWDSIYDLVSEKEIAKNLFAYKNLNQFLIKAINPYLDDENYELLREKLQDAEINYIDAPLEEIHHFIKNRKYDGITLSNIYEYLNYGFSVSYENALKFREHIMENIYPHLKSDGKIMVSYMYAFSEEVSKFVLERYNGNVRDFISTTEIEMGDLDRYLCGLTTQNLSYALLLQAFANDNIERIETEHIVYGQSNDMSHDMALMVRK